MVVGTLLFETANDLTALERAESRRSTARGEPRSELPGKSRGWRATIIGSCQPAAHHAFLGNERQTLAAPRILGLGPQQSLNDVVRLAEAELEKTHGPSRRLVAIAPGIEVRADARRFLGPVSIVRDPPARCRRSCWRRSGRFPPRRPVPARSSRWTGCTSSVATLPRPTAATNRWPCSAGCYACRKSGTFTARTTGTSGSASGGCSTKWPNVGPATCICTLARPPSSALMGRRCPPASWNPCPASRSWPCSARSRRHAIGNSSRKRTSAASTTTSSARPFRAFRPL